MAHYDDTESGNSFGRFFHNRFEWFFKSEVREKKWARVGLFIFSCFSIVALLYFIYVSLS